MLFLSVFLKKMKVSREKILVWIGLLFLFRIKLLSMLNGKLMFDSRVLGGRVRISTPINSWVFTAFIQTK